MVSLGALGVAGLLCTFVWIGISDPSPLLLGLIGLVSLVLILAEWRLLRLARCPELHTVEAGEAALRQPSAPGAPAIRWEEIGDVRHSVWGGFCVEDASGTCRVHVSAEVEDLNDLLDVMSHKAPELCCDPPVEIAQPAWRRPLSYLTGLVILGLYVASVGRLGTGMSILLGCLVAYLGWTAYREERFATRSIRVDDLTLAIASRSGSTVINLADIDATEITLAGGLSPRLCSAFPAGDSSSCQWSEAIGPFRSMPSC